MFTAFAKIFSAFFLVVSVGLTLAGLFNHTWYWSLGLVMTMTFLVVNVGVYLSPASATGARAAGATRFQAGSTPLSGATHR